MALSGKLIKKLVEKLGAGRHGDVSRLYLVVEPSGARRWIARGVVKGQKNKKGGPLRTDFGLGSADLVTLSQVRERVGMPAHGVAGSQPANGITGFYDLGFVLVALLGELDQC